ncbi:MAG: hypothetical protein ACTMUB_03155 [cyanobacterium endosymbiont of Rhopalodia musculus]|uniref:hypothetical protein n=1 Tax=cyanobacterium endosymbiont of Epithemia clementina EcSB TaxID=3034674 RepID=UPI0024805E31|nr:hypothetical protein [cyanobacterium endosymbiont of Epithemia clementina EcSB]WGT67209.1 hypothetical protein P3F56_08315 [cyanobacterium endosymbiont of Epithemia clementina EcSB]
MWNKNEVIRFPQIKNLSPSLILSNFFRFKKKKINITPHQNTQKIKHNIITIIIENSSSGKLSFKESKSWNGQTGIYQIPQDINPGELVTFDLRKDSLKKNQGVVVYQIMDHCHQDYLLIIGWSDLNSLKLLNHAFIKLMLIEDYQQTNFEKIQTWIDNSESQSYSIVNGYSACAKAITKGSLPLWVNCLN